MLMHLELFSFWIVVLVSVLFISKIMSITTISDYKLPKNVMS